MLDALLAIAAQIERIYEIVKRGKLARERNDLLLFAGVSGSNGCNAAGSRDA